MRTSDRCTTRRYERRRAPRRSQVDDLATGLGDAVERLVRALDPGVARPGLGDLFGAVAPEEDCVRCRPGRCCPACCEHHDHEHDHHHDHGHPLGCGCDTRSCDRCPPRCGPDSCACDCCIGDADVVVYTRVGEQRVVPITVENHRKRERLIKMQLGEFRSKGGNDSPVKGKLLAPTEFTLAPCGQHDGIIVINAGFIGREKPTTGRKVDAAADLDALSKAELIEEAERLGVEARASMTKATIIGAIAERPPGVVIDRPTDVELPDVDDCHVAVADLCVEGCDSRPIRIAVAVLPRVCNSFEIRCDCACC